MLRNALLASLAASAGLALWPEAGDPVALPVDRPQANATARPASASVAPRQNPTPRGLVTARPASPLPTRPGDWPAPDAGALTAWQGRADPPNAAQRPVTVASAPAARTPPEFPYRWIGQLDDGAGLQVLLANAQRSFGVRVGEVVDQR
ncbi:MAG: hypothetical protein CFE45_18415, partial [Burkholderiales bacterium PBB5]